MRCIATRVTALALIVGMGFLGAPATGAVADPLPPPDPAEVAKADPEGDALSAHSRELLGAARAAREPWVTVMALTAPGGTAALAGRLSGLGASVGYRHDKVGYVRATLPTDRVEQAARLEGVQSMDLDEMLRAPEPSVESGASRASGSGKWTGPGPDTPAVNPYLPTHETGAVAFTAAHPAFDGRGVTIGVLDSGVDLDHPALASTSTGERKVTDWITATDPLLESDATWRPMLTRVEGPTASYGGATWRLPNRTGEFAMNAFSESAAAGNEDIKGDIDRDGDTGDSWGVLYEYTSHDIWVDVDQDRVFSDAERMRPYDESYQVNHFGVDDPGTAVSERMPFVVEFREDVDLTPAGLAGQRADFVNIGLVSDGHGTHVAGIAAGHGILGGLDGAAPGAKVVSAKACVFAGGCTVVALTEGVIRLVADEHVDVVNISIGGLPGLNDGNNTRARLYDRIIDTYGVQLFVSAGNSGAGLNSIGDPAVATDVVSVAASASKDTWKANYGADVTAPLWAQNYSSRGPREDGGFGPDLMAPGSAISSVPMFLAAEQVAEVSYRLPPGYAMYNGTSMAAPQATGAAALLLSAGRGSDVPIRPEQLRESLATTARFVPGLEAVAQGSGQVDVVRAWEMLRSAPDVASAYTVSAPVCTPLADLLATKRSGTGLYNRCSPRAGGQRTGEERTYEVTITRTAGARGAVEHRLSWVGDDSTFDSPARVSLPLGRPVTVPVRARPGTRGLHSAYLAIDAPETPLVDARMMTAVVAAQGLDRAPHTQRVSASVERARAVSYFVDVPKGAGALQVNLAGIAAGSQVRWIAYTPNGVPVESTGSRVCFTHFSPAKGCDPVSRAYRDPIPGVWEIQVEARRTTPFTTNPFTVRAAAQGVTVTPPERDVASARAGVPVPVTWRVRNELADVTVRGRGGPLGSARVARPTIIEGARQRYTVEVPQGATRVQATIGGTSDPSADLDLTVYDASGAIVGQSGDGDSEEAVTIASPKPGTYTVEVTGFSVAEGGTAYDYLDLFASPSLGTLDVDPTAVALGRGEEAAIRGELTARGPAAEGRRLVGVMEVVSSEGAVVGSGRVLVADVVTRGGDPTRTP